MRETAGGVDADKPATTVFHWSACAGCARGRAARI
jgi:hypothetical protein